MYILTKSKITTGLKCPKRLWFDINQPIKKDSYLFHLGNRFGDFARYYYGHGLDLTNNKDVDDVLAKTKNALADRSISIIYEGAFLFDNTLVRTDVLVRRGNEWDLIEVKSSSGLRDSHIPDASAQAYVVQNNGIKLNSIKIAHINDEFRYPGNLNYKGLLIEADITTLVVNEIPKVGLWIKDLIPIATKGASIPEESMGNQCGSGSTKCNYFSRCEDSTNPPAEVPISILPNVGKRMSQKWAPKGIFDLRDLPDDAFSKPNQKIIQQAHISNEEWVSPELIRQINAFMWPRFFMDFETVQQGVPLILGTKPRERLAFQWSIHRWSAPDQKLDLRGNKEFLEFTGENLERRFLISLIEELGETGPIFAHNADFERGMLLELSKKDGCLDLKPKVEAIIDRLSCTLKMVRGGFYSPKMNGSYSLKDIVKAIPDSARYKSSESENEVGNGGDAMIAWFDYTDSQSTEAQKKSIENQLKKYCAQDTYNLYLLFKHLLNKG